MKRLVLLLVGLLFAAAGFAQPIALPTPPQAQLQPHIGAQVPLDLRLVNEANLQVRLRDYFENGKPVLLVLGYYRCPELCGLLMHDLLNALQQSQVPRRDWRIVGVSIDPQDSPVTARQRRALDVAYADFLAGAEGGDEPLRLDLLTGAEPNLLRLARSVGFAYTPLRAVKDDPQPARFAHPATVVVLTPEGKISRYLNGIGLQGDELRLALTEAAEGRIGTLSDRIALLCAHFDPQVGRYSNVVMNGMRAVGLLGAAGLFAWMWRRRHAHGAQR